MTKTNEHKTPKIGVDDFFVAGNNLQDLKDLACTNVPETPNENLPLDNTQYGIYEGHPFVVQNKGGVKVRRPLSNFTAKIIEEVLIDDGIEENRHYVIDGTLADGTRLPKGTVTASEFQGLNWIHRLWGAGPTLYAGPSTKDHMRTFMQLARNGNPPRKIYSHTGWLKIDNKWVFLTPGGAIGNENIAVDLGAIGLEHYNLPLDTSKIICRDAMRNSIDLLDIGKAEVMYSLIAAMYLAPNTDILNPTFVPWISGPSGTLKSSVSGVVLSHFGDFYYYNLPLNWDGTSKAIMRILSALKDFPTVIDDWAPGATTIQQRELEQKAETVIRSVGNKANRVKLRSDGTILPTHRPRGIVIATAEQLPGGESRNSRLLNVPIAPGDIDIEALTFAQCEQWTYKYAMSYFIHWLASNRDHLQTFLPEQCEKWRRAAMAENTHLRIPNTVSWLFAGIYLALTFAEESGSLSSAEVDERKDIAWKSFGILASRHASTVTNQRPAIRFLNAFRALLSQDRLVFIDKRFLTPTDALKDIRPPKVFCGWEDENHYYLLPEVIHTCVYEFFNKGAEPFTVKPRPVWDDLAVMGYTDPVTEERKQTNIKIGEGSIKQNKWTVPLRKSVVVNEE